MKSLALLGWVLAAGCKVTPSDHLQNAKDAVFEHRPEEALVEYRKALDGLRRDSSAESQVLRARALKGAADVYRLELRKVKEAVSVYRELLQQCPESAEALESRVVLSELLRVHYRDLRGAIDQLTAALARNPPEGAELHYQVAKLYFELGDFEQAELEARKLAERFPTSAFVDDALFLQGQALAMVEPRKAESARIFSALVSRFPDSPLAPHAAFEVGKVREELGENEKAIEAWVQALKTHPDPSVVQAAIARVRRRVASTTPSAIGIRALAFDKGAAPPPGSAKRAPRSSAEAVGASPEEAAREHGE